MVDRKCLRAYDNIILNYHILFMSTLSIPLSPEQEQFVESLVKRNIVPNKAEAVRRALRLLAEEEAVAAVLKAEQEPTLKGNLRTLMKKIR
mgnify:CR=1 FL=1